MKRNYEMDMCSGPILGKLLTFTIPLIFSGILQLLFNAADVIVVGRFAGSQSLAAVGSTTALINLMINIFIGLSVGVNVIVARYYGAKREKDVQDTIHTAMALSIVSGLFLIVMGQLLSRPMLELMGTPDDVIDKSTIYMRIIFIGMPANMIYNFGSAILRAVGDTKRPLYFLTAAGVINVVLNLFFVIMFRMDVAGVALATAISQAISAFLVIRCLMESEGSLKLHLKDLKIHRSKFRQIIQVGLPAGMQGAVFSISNVLIQSSVNSFGSVAMAGNTTSQNIDECGLSGKLKLHEPELRRQKVFEDQPDYGYLPRRCDGSGTWNGNPGLSLWTCPDPDLLLGPGGHGIRNEKTCGFWNDIFPLRDHGYDGGQHPRPRILRHADVRLSSGSVRATDRLDLYSVSGIP